MDYFTNLKILLVALIISFFSASLLQCDDEIKMKDYFDAGEQKVLIEQYKEFRFREIPNLEEGLRQNILSEYPKNLESLLLLTEFHYHKTGNLDESRRILFELEYYLRRIANEISEADSFYTDFVIVRDQASFVKQELNSNFGQLKFKVKGVDIEKFALINGAQIVLQISEALFGQASSQQALRLQFLEKKYGQGENDIYFTSYDSSSGQIYFSISDFPYINYREDKPYAIIVNNNKRYHFDFRRDSEPVEIQWVEDWTLVEAVPPNEIKLEFGDGRPYFLDNEKLLASGMSFYAIDNPDLMPHYLIKVQNNEKIELKLADNYQGRIMGKALSWTTRFVIIGASYFLISNVKERSAVNVD
jgi:cellobiose-specific phosphotransferase system component IIB